ncbi:MAG: hypothetical protein M3246_02030 [Actinomycetota bacterium]|nr:hypothetical protein [Actinomycetota bacterium]
MLRTYARVAGIVLFVLGAGGLVGIWDVTPVGRIAYMDDVLYLFTAAIFLYVGFARTSPEEIRYVAGGMGLLYLLSSGLLAAALLFFGLYSGAYELAYALIHAAFGILSILAAGFLDREDRSSARS